MNKSSLLARVGAASLVLTASPALAAFGGSLHVGRAIVAEHSCDAECQLVWSQGSNGEQEWGTTSSLPMITGTGTGLEHGQVAGVYFDSSGGSGAGSEAGAEASLPSTGPDTMTLTWLGLGLLATGGAVRFIARRRSAA